MANINNILQKLAGLGVALSGVDAAQNVDPEKTIIESLSFVHEDRKVLQLLMSALFGIHELIHAERLKALAKDISELEMAWLGVIFDYIKVHTGDKRFLIITQFGSERVKSKSFSQSKFDLLRFEKQAKSRSNKDHPAGSNFGLRIPQSDLKIEMKKIRDSKIVIERNIWLQMRKLFGTNWRADMASLILLDVAANSYQAQKILGCSSETAYRNWQALADVEIKKIIRLQPKFA